LQSLNDDTSVAGLDPWYLRSTRILRRSRR
jgi:hypothetical protein